MKQEDVLSDSNSDVTDAKTTADDDTSKDADYQPHVERKSAKRKRALTAKSTSSPQNSETQKDNTDKTSLRSQSVFTWSKADLMREKERHLNVDNGFSASSLFVVDD